MDFPTYISLPFAQSQALPSEYDFNDVRYAPALVEHIVSRYTEPGQVVFDPFTGFGTTLSVAKSLGRQAYGVEIDDDKVDYLLQYLGLEVIHGDVSRLFLDRILPPIDLVMTSPPYMGREDKADALTGYRYAGSYERYLDKLGGIFKQIRSQLNPQAKVVVEVSNLKQERGVTTLAWDVGHRLAEVLTFEGEIIVTWTGERGDRGIYNYGYDHSYCLVYTR